MAGERFHMVQNVSMAVHHIGRQPTVRGQGTEVGGRGRGDQYPQLTMPHLAAFSYLCLSLSLCLRLPMSCFFVSLPVSISSSLSISVSISPHFSMSICLSPVSKLGLWPSPTSSARFSTPPLSLAHLPGP